MAALLYFSNITFVTLTPSLTHESHFVVNTSEINIGPSKPYNLSAHIVLLFQCFSVTAIKIHLKIIHAPSLWFDRDVLSGIP